MAKFKISFIFELPGNVSAEDVAEYVRSGVRSYGGSFHPEDIFFGLEEDAIQKMNVTGLYRDRGDNYRDK